MNSNKMYYFLLGWFSMAIISAIIMFYYPVPKTEQACQQCIECWWFELAEGDK